MTWVLHFDTIESHPDEWLEPGPTPLRTRMRPDRNGSGCMRDLDCFANLQSLLCDEPRLSRSEEAIECLGKDLSQTGIGFYLPHELTTTEIIIEVPNTLHPPVVKIPASLVRAKRCADGWYDVGAIFRLPTLKRSEAEIALEAAAR